MVLDSRVEVVEADSELGEDWDDGADSEVAGLGTEFEG